MLKGLKRSVSFIVALIMIVATIPFSVFAEQSVFTMTYSEQYVPDSDDIPDNDELFALYVQNELDSSIYGDIAMFGSAGDRLAEGSIMKTVYNEIKDSVSLIAEGNRASATIDFGSSVLDSLKWTESELGSAIIVDGKISVDAQTAIKEKLFNLIDTKRILAIILSDLPYELYWFDKTIGINTEYSVSASYGYGNVEASAWISVLKINFTVASDYRGAGIYTTNTAKTSATSSAIQNAKAIVGKHSSKSDLDKLKAYKEEICELVSYNYDAADSGLDVVGINPWQLIYVFDRNSDTNVVCEGYSKAFKYLCDLSAFDEDIHCYTVSGLMDGGNHMWNVVDIGENRYLADITNCDDGTIGAPDKLFLVIGESYSNGKIHYIDLDFDSIEYDYDLSQKDLFCDGYLVLKEVDEQEDLEFVNSGFHIPDTTLGTAIAPIDVSNGVSGGLKPYSFSATNLPDGIMINSTSGIISGTPSATTSTETTATITVTDANGNTKSIYITVGIMVKPHSCVFNQKIAVDEFFVLAANCTSGSLYHFSCVCGNEGSEIFEADDKLGHDYTKEVEETAFIKTEATNCTQFNTYWYNCSRCPANAKNDPDATNSFFVSSINGEHCFEEKIEDDAHFVANIDYDCQTHLKYYYDCKYCNTIGNTAWESAKLGNHDFTGDWISENGKHYHECLISNCNATDEAVKCSGGTATCTTKAVCGVCKKAYGDFAPHNLKFVEGKSSSCTENGNIEYYICSCGKLFEDKDATKAIANESDTIIPLAKHIFDIIDFDENSHWLNCKCGEQGESDTHVDVNSDGKCDSCPLEMEIIEILDVIIGDTDNNGIIEADDYILLKRIYFGTANTARIDDFENIIARADININGEIDADDYILSKRLYFGTYKVK